MSNPELESVRLGRSAGFGRPIVRALITATCAGLLFAGLGVLAFAEGAEGLLAAVGWVLVTCGLGSTVIGGLLLLMSRREGGPSVLSADGIAAPGGMKDQAIGWRDVERCEIRLGSGGARLLAAWVTPGRTKEPKQIWLGDARATGVPEEVLLRQIDQWIRQSARRP
ncbi:hypothetical protein [Actinomadura alba]|uniref:PH domain-containing protein n=1 Tax=Actinomadura alba TaxID=406431 RepID=A0ABR7LND0_9ACTN|nr:hypothetical protein [Actinomadura alba]MBC6466352.1 hypothetical protein [Actinomadura alba]